MSDRRAIVADGVVVNVVIGGSTGIAVPSGTPVGPGWTYDGSDFAAPIASVAVEPDVRSITRTQLWLWLHDNGFPNGLDNTTVAAVLAQGSAVAQIRAQTAREFVVDDTNLIALAAALATTSGQAIDLQTAFNDAARDY